MFDAVLAANLVCRLPDPMLFLNRLPSLVKPGGIAVIISPHSWLAAWTPKSKWIGGFSKDGKPVHTSSAMSEILSKDFDLVAREDMPFLVSSAVKDLTWRHSYLHFHSGTPRDPGIPHSPGDYYERASSRGS